MVKLFRMYSNLCDHNPPTLQKDRQTTCDRNTALCTKVHRTVKIEHGLSISVDGAAPSVLRMILICCNHVLNLTGDFGGGGF